MFDALKQRWRRFMTAPRGTRFQAHYRRHHRRRRLVRAIVATGAGLVLIAIGFVLLVLPGPGLLVAAIGAALLAGESRTVAKLLDGVDRSLGQVWTRIRRARRRKR